MGARRCRLSGAVHTAVDRVPNPVWRQARRVATKHPVTRRVQGINFANFFQGIDVAWRLQRVSFARHVARHLQRVDVARHFQRVYFWYTTSDARLCRAL